MNSVMGCKTEIGDFGSRLYSNRLYIYSVIVFCIVVNLVYAV